MVNISKFVMCMLMIMLFFFKAWDEDGDALSTTFFCVAFPIVITYIVSFFMGLKN